MLSHLAWLAIDVGRWRATGSWWALGFAVLMAWTVARDLRRRRRRRPRSRSLPTQRTTRTRRRSIR